MDTILFLGFAAAYLALLVWGVRLAMRNGWWTPANLPLLVVAALILWRHQDNIRRLLAGTEPRIGERR